MFDLVHLSAFAIMFFCVSCPRFTSGLVPPARIFITFDYVRLCIRDFLRAYFHTGLYLFLSLCLCLRLCLFVSVCMRMAM